MKEYQEKVAKMSEEEKKEQMLKSYTVLNNLPRSQAEQIKDFYFSLDRDKRHLVNVF